MTILQAILYYGYLATLGIAAFISLISFIRGYAIHWKLFSLFLIAYFIVECVGYYLASKRIENHGLYNPAFVVMFMAEAYLFYHLLDNKVVRRIIIFFWFTFLVFYTINSIYLQNRERIETNIYIFGGTFIIILSVLYFIKLYLAPHTESILKDPGFWISFGLILGYVGEIPFMGMLNYLLGADFKFTYSYFFIIFTLDIVVEICILISYLCPREKMR